MSISKQNAQRRLIDAPFSKHSDETPSGFTTEDAVRFWRKVDRGVGREDCWRWTAGKLGRDGYGGFSVARGKPRGHAAPAYAHRVAYELMQGPIPVGQSVLHRCDNPICVNPSHLFLGTQADNMRDAASKGRLHAERPRGQKLTTNQLIEIDALFAVGMPQVSIARQFGVSKGWVSAYLKGERRQFSIKRTA